MHRTTRVAIAAALLASCESATGPQPLPAPAAVQAVSGNGQTAPAGTLLPDPVVVRVTDEDGELLDGGVVVFRVIAGGGTVREGTARTGADGMAGEHWTLGTTAGEQALEARVLDAGGTPLVADTFASTATPAAPSQITITGGDGQSGAPGQPLPAWLGVRLQDPYGNAVPGWTVEWAVLAGGGAVQPATSVTDTNGEARTQWVMGPGNGAVRASAQGVPPVTFAATATPVPASISVLNGNAQRGPAGDVPPNPMVVRVLDAAGAPVAGAAVQWQVTAGGGALRNPEVVTDAGGLATTEWVLGPRVGPFHSLEARVSGVDAAASFTAAALTPGTVTIARISGDAQTSRLGTPLILAQPLVVEVRLADGQPLQGAVVSWTPSSGGSVAPASSTTDASGRASTSWTLGSVLGTQQLTSVLGTRSSAFTGTALTATRVELQRGSIVVETGQTDSVAVLVEGPGAGSDSRWGVLDSTVAGSWALGSRYRYTRVTGRKPGTTKLLVQAGDGADTLVVTVRPLSEEFVSLAAADSSACALTASGRLYCWGLPITPSLAAPVAQPAPVRVAELYRFDWLSMGHEGAPIQTMCAGTTNHYAYCWPAHDPNSPPRRLSTGPFWKMIDVSRSHSCGITTQGGAWCFGFGWAGQLGNGSTNNSVAPVAVSGGRQWMDVAAGSSHSCGLTSTGAAYCWGEGVFLGRSLAVTSSVPVAVEGGHTFTHIDAGGGRTCALDADGVAWCWGHVFSPVPAAVPGMTFRQIETDGQLGRLCGVGTDSRAYCWNSNNGTVGPGSPVSTTLAFRQVASLRASTCGITTGNKVYCWGANNHGELGQGDFAAHSGLVLVVGQP
jgi:alpha-tubulin suppressor-like RCC1 family protein